MKTLLCTLTALLLAAPALAADDIWHCLRDGSDTPNPVISAMTQTICNGVAGATGGTIYLYHDGDAGAQGDSAWLLIPEVSAGHTVDLFFHPDTNEATGAARIQVVHSTSWSDLPINGDATDGTRVIQTATLTGVDPYAWITNIEPGQIRILTTTDAGAGEDSLVVVRVTNINK